MTELLVTGATGCIGRAVVAAAQQRGWHVRGLARHAPAAPWADGVEVAVCDVRDRAAVARVAAGCDAIVHLAGWVHRVPRDDGDRAELRSSIVGGTGTVAVVAAGLGARLVVTSTVAVFDQSEYGRAKLEAEAVAVASCPEVLVLRPAVVYGRSDRGNVVALIRMVDRRLGLIVGPGSNRKSMIYVENLADRILEGIVRRDLTGTWIATDEPAPTQAEIVAEIARALGRRPPLALPRWPVLTAAALADVVGRAGRAPAGPSWHERVRGLTRSTVFSGAALDETLGYRPRVSWSEAIRTTVAWYRGGERLHA